MTPILEPGTPDCEHGYRAAGGTYDCPACEEACTERDRYREALDTVAFHHDISDGALDYLRGGAAEMAA